MATLAISVQPDVNVELAPGDRVLIKGTTDEGFRPFVIANSITVLRHGALAPGGTSDL